MKTGMVGGIAGLVLASVLQCSGAAIGDPAPGLAIERWIKGSPVALTPGTNIYVVEFWATWCGPCKQTIPHLTDLHRKYSGQGVVIIGISDEQPDQVTSFVTQQGEGMAYRVAVDTSRRTFNAWMNAYGGRGIPHAFIVDRSGKVAWHGFPSGNFDRALEEIMNGKYNLTTARQLEMGDRLITQYESIVNSGRDHAKAAAVADKIITDYALDWKVPHRLARLILTDKELRSRDYNLALKATTKATGMVTNSSDALDMHARALYMNGQAAEAVAVQERAIARCQDPGERAEMEKRKAVYQKKSGV